MTADEDAFDDPYEESAYFTGDCTCDHDKEYHGWGSCDELGCRCEAGWEE